MLRTSALSLPMTSGGVPFGAETPHQMRALSPSSPTSAAVGMEGSDVDRLSPDTANTRTVPAVFRLARPAVVMVANKTSICPLSSVVIAKVDTLKVADQHIVDGSAVE